ncbi:MAG: DDE-type integrase/transposase/recombinase, partial [Oscillospiraceae bacterium]
KQIVGYAFSERIDAALVCQALHMAARRHRPPKGLIHHSDRGVQYACNAYQQALTQYHMVPSMSRKGDPYDNAVAENFFGKGSKNKAKKGKNQSKKQTAYGSSSKISARLSIW